MSMMIKGERGNILFLILIAVALFAALALAISQSSRNSGKDASQEKSQLLLDQLTQYGSSLTQAVTRVILSNNCSLNTVDFSSPRWTADYYDISAVTNGPQSPPDNRCDIFDVRGGNIIWQSPPKDALAIPGREYVITAALSVEGVGTTAYELTMLAEVTKDVCMKANEQEKITAVGATPPDISGDPNFNAPTPVQNWKAFGAYPIENNAGNRFPVALAVLGMGSNGPEFRGHMMGCYHQTDSNVYVFYQVMIPR